MSEYPRFYETNSIKKDQDIFDSVSGEGIIENAFDYSGETEWVSSGSNDTTTEIIDIEFYSPDGDREQRTFNTMILIGINIKLCRLYKNNWNGSGWDGWVLVDTTSNNSNNNIIKEFTELTTYRIKLEMDTTIVANEQKYIKEFILTRLLWEATMPMDVYSVDNIKKGNVTRLYDGKGQYIHQYEKWSSRIEFRQISKLELDELRAIYNLHTAFIIMPEPYDSLDNYYLPDECYRVLWTSSWNQKYFTNVKGVGYNIKLILEEV